MSCHETLAVIAATKRLTRTPAHSPVRAIEKVEDSKTSVIGGVTKPGMMTRLVS